MFGGNLRILIRENAWEAFYPKKKELENKKQETKDMNTKTKKIKAGAFAVAMLFLAMAAATTIKADPPFVPSGVIGRSQQQVHPVPPTPPSYQVIWDAEYPDGLIPMDSVADRNNDVIIGGISQMGSGLVVKYSGPTGDVIWSNDVTDEVNALWTPEHEDQNPYHADLHTIRNLMIDMNNQRFGFDTSDLQIFVGGVDVDSNNDVVVVATATDVSQDDLPQDVIVAKYNSEDGALIWDKFITFYTYDFSMGITVDKNDNVIVAGASGGVELREGHLIPLMEGWMYKLAGSDGHMLHTDHIFGIAQPLPYYFDVDSDSQNNYFATGPALIIDWSDFPHNLNMTQTSILNKYNAALHLVNTQLWPVDPYTFILTVCVDSSDYVYVGGWIITNGWSREYIVKFNNNIDTVLWTIPNEYYFEKGTIMKLANISNVKIVAAAQLTDYDGYMTTEIFRASNGRHYFRINEGKDFIQDTYAMTVAVDRANDITTSAMKFPPETGDWYTMKYHVRDGSPQMEMQIDII
jgi:hypothetical protein